jgi:putative tricarboxylic transport membrane protein
VNSADRVTAALLLAFAVAFTGTALKYYPYWTETGPGQGFLPIWLGGVMAALALLMLLRRSRNETLQWPRGEGLRHMLVLLAATVVFVAVLKTLGMMISTAAYLAFVVWFLGRHRWWITLGVAAGAALLNWLVFVHWLRVPFPELGVWIF